MASAKIQTKILKSKSGYSILIPEAVWNHVQISPKDQLFFYINDREHFEVEVVPQGKAGLCELCKQKSATRTCINCKREVCVTCYWELGGLCKGCMKK